MLSELTGLTRPELALHKDLRLDAEALTRWRDWVNRLILQEPLQYILGHTCFYGLDLLVDPCVLIPRPETECLVQWILNREQGLLAVLDIGTGSGAIALALKHHNPDLKITATDISHPAILLARANARRLGLELRFTVADLFPKKPEKFDLIVSNPPYVSTSEFSGLAAEISLHEPQLALLAGKDGLDAFRRILAKAAKRLSYKGRIYLEIGETQARSVIELARENGFLTSELRKDLAGRDRCLCLSR